MKKKLALAIVSEEARRIRPRHGALMSCPIRTARARCRVAILFEKDGKSKLGFMILPAPPATPPATPPAEKQSNPFERRRGSILRQGCERPATPSASPEATAHP